VHVDVDGDEVVYMAWQGEVSRNKPREGVQWFRGGLEFKTHRLLYHPQVHVDVDGDEVVYMAWQGEEVLYPEP